MAGNRKPPKRKANPAAQKVAAVAKQNPPVAAKAPVTLVQVLNHAARMAHTGRIAEVQALLVDVLPKCQVREGKEPVTLSELLVQTAVRLRNQHPAVAAQLVEQAVEKDPNHMGGWSLLSSLRDRLGNLKGAREACMHIVKSDLSKPDQKLAAANLLVRFKEDKIAIESATKAFHDLGSPLSWASSLLYIALKVADWPLVDELTQQLLAAHRAGLTEEARESPRTHVQWCDDEAINVAVLKDWNQRNLPMPANVQVPTVQPLEGRRIRVGYLSSDFREHPTSRLINGLLRHHDRTKFELFMYCSGWDDKSAMRKEVESHFDHIHTVTELSDAHAANLMRTHNIDVLVELNGPTRANRMGILAHRPAPVQIDYLGWPGSVGGRLVDYVVGDDYTVPEGVEKLYPEKLIRIRETYQVNDYAARTPPPALTRKEVGLPEGVRVLGMFNAINKVRGDVWAVWMRILKAEPNTVLWLLDPGGLGRVNIAKATVAAGVDPKRIVIAVAKKQDEHLARLQCCDLMLDPWPYGGHTSTSDALFAGVPVLTLEGKNFVSRVSGGLLKAARMQVLVQPDIEGYVNMALQLLRTPAELQRIKAHIKKHISTTDVFNATSKARQFEAVYRNLLERRLKDLPPVHISLKGGGSRPQQKPVPQKLDPQPHAVEAESIKTSEVSSKADGKPFLISLYLPQFHPIPENDSWWGKGFTEWTNVAKAKPLYAKHYQPHVPTDLGFYDLRLPEAREEQAALAKQYGIDAFCYYHYWFAGRRVLERPFNEVVASGKPDLPFLACWANETWTGVWHGAPNKVLLQQSYPGDQDYIDHFNELLPAFKDPRYVTFEGKPMFAVWAPSALPDPKHFAALWRDLAKKAGLPGLYLVGAKHTRMKWQVEDIGFDVALPLFMPPRKVNMHKGVQYPTIYKYEDIYEKFIPQYPADGKTYPCVKPNWDNTPRSGVNGLVFEGATPEMFRKQFTKALDWSKGMPENNRVIFIKAWNEWAEGNCLEPEIKHGDGYLAVIQECLKNY
jgi:predicted O-linked N-acetylglucosamine transferase (SPINDLY family)